MVESNVLGLIVIGVFVFAIAVVTCVTVIIWNILTYKHEQGEQEKRRELELKEAILDYKAKIHEADVKAKQNTKPEINDPKPQKAPEADIAQWFEIMSDPDMLFGEVEAKTETKEVK